MTWRKISGSSSEKTWLIVASTSASATSAPVVPQVGVEQLHAEEWIESHSTRPPHRQAIAKLFLPSSDEA